MDTLQTFDINGATVTVWHDGQDREPDSRIDRYTFRQRYGYRIIADGWEYVSNDIHSGVSADVDVADAARTLFSFLSACAESRDYRNRHGVGENADLFPEHVGQWAEENSDEISILSLDPEEM